MTNDTLNETISTTASTARPITRYLGFALLLALCFAACWYPLDNSNDFWAHAAVGRWIVDHRSIPHHALFLWTSHQSWVAHSWLSEVVIYFVANAGGDGIAAVLALLSTTLFAFGAFAVVWRAYKTNWSTAGIALAVVTIAVYCSSGRFFPRPEVMSLFLISLLAVLLVYRDLAPSDALDRKLRIGLPIAFMLWTNLHGAMLSGLILVWTYAIAGLVQDDLNTRSKSFAITAGISTIATLINPYGFHYYSIYRAVQTQTFKNIIEWRPMLSTPHIPYLMLGLLGILTAIAVGFWVYSPAKRWAHLLWLITLAAIAFEARRNVGYFSVVALAVAIPGMRRLAEVTSTAVRRRIVVIVAGLVVGLSIYGYGAWTAFQGLGSWPPESISPTLAASRTAYIIQNKIGGRLFATYEDASYLEWRFGEMRPLNIDALNAYPDYVFSDYNATLTGPDGLQNLDDEGVDCVVGRGHVAGQPDYPHLWVSVARSPEWALVYYGPDGPVWVRRIPHYQSLWQGVGTFHGTTRGEFRTYLNMLTLLAASNQIRVKMYENYTVA